MTCSPLDFGTMLLSQPKSSQEPQYRSPGNNSTKPFDFPHRTPEAPEDLAGLDRKFDTIICLNVLEYLKGPAAALAAMRDALKPGGNIALRVPNNPALFGALDRSLGHLRRYAPADLRGMLENLGFQAQRIRGFNRAGAPPLVGLQPAVWLHPDQ